MSTPTTLIDRLLRYKQLLFLATGLAILTGVLALVFMPRDEYPQFRVVQGLIIGVYPGASSRQVEEQLTAKVEQYLFQYKSVNRAKTYSVSKENLMIVYVWVDESEKDPEAFWAKLRHGLNDLRNELPSGVLSLTTDNDFGNTSVMLLGVESESKTYRELEEYAKSLENELRKISSIAKIKHLGMQKEQINLYVDNAKLTHYGVKPLQVLAALKPQNAVNYAGELDDSTLITPIHVPPNFSTEQDVANQIVYADPAGHVLRVKDIARVVREYETPESYIRVNGTKCLVIQVEMKTGDNVVSLGDDVNEAVRKFSATLPPDVKIETVSDVPYAVSSAIRNFLKEFGIAIVSVILVTVLLLPRRVARIAAMSIPTSIFTALGIMWLWGLDLQSVSLAGLIIVLGITVDDAIVIIDNYIEKLDIGMTPFEAASKSVTELFSSVLSATLIIIICFLPMPLFSTGAVADFVRTLPLSIMFALVVSLLVSISLIPLVNFKFIKTGVKSTEEKKGKSLLDTIQGYYDLFIEAVFRKKKTVVLLGIASFVGGLAIFATIPQQSFPNIERNQFAVEVTLPEGTSLQQTDLVLRDLESRLRSDQRVTTVTAFVGTGSPRFHTLYAPSAPKRNYGQLVVLTKDNKTAVEVLDQYSRELKGHYPAANVKWKQLALVISQSPIEIRISGDSLAVIKQVAANILASARSIKGIYYATTDYEEPRETAELIVNKDEAARMGYSNSLLSYWTMVGTRGLPLTTVWEGDYPVNVNLKIDKRLKSRPDDILNEYVTSPYLVSTVPIRQLATIQPGWSEGSIVRRNGVRTITVRAELDRGIVPPTVFSTLKKIVGGMKLPEGVSIAYGGDEEDNIESITPFYYSLSVSIAIIFLILMFQFKSVKTSLTIMLTLPLAIFGAAFGILVTGYPFGVTAFIGLIGLLGIVVRNGVILISYANELQLNEGYTAEEAAIAAGKRRMRPVFLTSAAAAVGVVPMTVGRSPLWGPMGTVICFGLMFALVLSLVVLPVIYYYLNRSTVHHVVENEKV